VDIAPGASLLSVSATTARLLGRRYGEHPTARRTQQEALGLVVEAGRSLLELAGRWGPTLVHPLDLLAPAETERPARSERVAGNNVAIPLGPEAHQVPLGETFLLVENRTLVPASQEAGELEGG
jgi:hypothetical protein